MPEISATIRVVDAFSNPLDKLSNGLSRAQSGFSRLKGALGGNMFGGAEKSSGSLLKSMAGGVVAGNLISKGMSLAGAGINSMLGELNEASVSWQTFEGNMHQLGASNTEINKAKTEMQQFAQQTIYSASDMSSTYAQLAAVGTKNTAQLVKGFGGLASAADNPQQAMKTLSEQATQMAAKPKVQWQDFKLMLEQTPAGISAVAKTMGESTTQLIKDIQDGKVKTQDFLNAVAKTGTNANFSKMATQYKTVGQAMDGLKETLANKFQPAFDKVGQVGIKAVEQITDGLDGMDFSKVGDSLANGLQSALKIVTPIIKGVGSAFGDIFNGFNNTGAIQSAVSMFENIGSTLSNVFNSIKQSLGGENLFSNIGQGIGNVVSGIANTINTILPVLQGVGSNISSFISGIVSQVSGFASRFGTVFANAGSWLQPLISSFQRLQTALNPVFNVLGRITGVIGTLAIGGLVVGLAAFADSLMVVINIAMTFGNAVKVIVQGLHAVGDALTGNFSGAKRDIEDAKSAIDGVKSSLSNIFNGNNYATGKVIGAFSQISSQAKNTQSTVNGMKMTPKVDVSGVNSQLSSISNKKIPGPKVEEPKLNFTNPFQSIITQAKSTKLPSPKMEAPKLPNTTNVTNQMKAQMPKSIPGPKVQTPKVEGGKSISASITNSMPKTIAAPKVKTPTVPQPKMPAGLKTMAAPKVKTPVVPQPKMPKLRTIPAPKVQRPNMSGVVSAVRSGMSRAAAAARAGGAQISAAVRSALNQAVAAARSAAGAMQAAGAMIGQGLAAGIRSQIGAVAAAANELVAQANRAARAAAQIHSPSRLFAEVGSFIGQGMAVGMDSTRGLISQSSKAMINSAYPGLNSSTNSSGSLSSSSIRPNSATSSNYYTGGTNNSSEVTIAPGAIVINSSGNPEEDADTLLDRLEEKIMEQANKSLS